MTEQHFITLFARSCSKWKVNSIDEAKESIEDFRNNHLQHNIQQFTSNYVVTKRKKAPIDVEISFYDWHTIEQMVEHFRKLNKSKGEKLR